MHMRCDARGLQGVGQRWQEHFRPPELCGMALANVFNVFSHHGMLEAREGDDKLTFGSVMEAERSCAAEDDSNGLATRD